MAIKISEDQYHLLLFDKAQTTFPPYLAKFTENLAALTAKPKNTV
jgi:hypothetical protein